ncbi:lasso peptide biosynthesis PqqD family chaperone [Streptomyces sp. 8N616]|uniref:lasso peptide biosynthesis PqqD family chaperone n=1 Tax=Streptomyces sp. 8N616 TaxID=3457414 RepID=UPI003FD3B59B
MSFSLADGVSIAQTGSGAVLLDERSGRYWQLNSSGARVLEKLLAGESVGEAGAAAASGTRVAPEKAAGDAAALLERLQAAGLVSR